MTATITLTGQETADQLVKQLVQLRHSARVVIGALDAWRAVRTTAQQQHQNALNSESEAVALGTLEKANDAILQLESHQIEIGLYLMPLCAELDSKATRDQVCDALNINPIDRHTEQVQKYGDTTLSLITVLHLENSATHRGESCSSREGQPLQWCHTMAFMRELRTNAKFDRIVHDGANEFFNGVFGEYRERPLMERLAGRAL